MKEEDVRHDIYKALQRYGYWPIHGRDVVVCPRCGNKMWPKSGRPDLIVLDPLGYNAVCEVKAVYIARELSLAFSRIENEQRRWLDAWTEAGGKGYLGIGTIEKNRGIWVIPWNEWKVAEHIVVGEGFSNIPVSFEYYKQLNRKLPSIAIDLEFSEHQLYRKKAEDGKHYWKFPDSHPLVLGRNTLWIQDPQVPLLSFQDGQ